MQPPIRPRLSSIKLAIWYFTLTVMHHTYQSQGHAAALGGNITSVHYQPTRKKYKPPATRNGPIHTEYRILKNVVSYTAGTEVGGLFHNGQTAVPLRITFHELGFTQPPTPLKTDNSTAEGIVTATVRQKSYKAMDMQFYWMKDRVKQKHFFVYWKPGIQNMGDYFTKHHPPHHHR